MSVRGQVTILAAGLWGALLLPGDRHYVSGWLLLLSLLLLAAYKLRKRQSVLAFGNVSAWRRVHVALGLIVLPLLPIHIGGALPEGTLGLLLAGLLAGVAVAGGVAAFVARSLPRALTARGGNVLFGYAAATRGSRSSRLTGEHYPDPFERTPVAPPDQDFQYRRQLQWRLVLLLHEVLGWALLVFVAVHVLRVYRVLQP